MIDLSDVSSSSSDDEAAEEAPRRRSPSSSRSSDLDDAVDLSDVDALGPSPRGQQQQQQQRRRRRRSQQHQRQSQRERQQQQPEHDPFAAWTEAPDAPNPRARLFDERPQLGPSTLVPLFEEEWEGGPGRRERDFLPFAHLRRGARGRLFVPAGGHSSDGEGGGGAGGGGGGGGGGEGGGAGVPWCLPPERPLAFPLRLGSIRVPAAVFAGPLARGGARAQEARQAAAASAALEALQAGPHSATATAVESLSFGRTYQAHSPAASLYETVPCQPSSGRCLEGRL